MTIPDSQFMNASAPVAGSPAKRRWRLRFGLRTLLVAMAVLGVGLGYVGMVIQRVRHQRQVVAKIEAAGGMVHYDYEFVTEADLEIAQDPDESPAWSTVISDGPDSRYRRDSAGNIIERQTEIPPGPRLVRRLLGDDAFSYVETVSFFWDDHAGDVDPRILLELPRLKVLAPRGNQVSDEWLACASQVPELRVLTLFGDADSSATSDGLAQLRDARQLEALGLVGDWVQDDVVAGTAGLRQLKSLRLASAPDVTSGVFAHLHDLVELRELTILQAEKIDDQGTQHVSQLHELRTLWLRDTSISDGSLVAISGLTQLQWLDVSATNVGDDGMQHLARLPNLKRLNLAQTGVGDAGVEPLARLPLLRHLDLGGTQVTDAGLPAIAVMAQLESLDLYPSGVTDRGLSHLQALKNLKCLRIGPHITKEAADVLRSALPGCEVARIDENGRSSYPD